MTPAPDLFSVADRAAIVTGASSGLGQRFARVLAANGARVLAVARRTDRLEALAAEWPGIVPCTADLADEAARAGVIDTAVAEFGGVDVLVNNAGYGNVVPALDEPIASFRAMLELNLVAAFELARLAARPMLDARRGSIINISSVLGLVAATPIPGSSYAASKGALINLTRQLGCEWARKGVRVNAIAPGFFPTEATEGMEAGKPGGDFVLQNCPMGRFGEPHELDGILLYLASDASTYCTGQTITIDGGWTAR